MLSTTILIGNGLFLPTGERLLPAVVVHLLLSLLLIVQVCTSDLNE
jgi:hypothetical protein